MKDTPVPLPDGNFNVWFRPARPGSPTAALVHGLTSTSRAWLPVIGHLPEDMGVIALDVRGRGESWQAPGPYDLKTIAEDIRRALDNFDIDKAIVVGHSMGAWIAALFAAGHPDRARRAILVDGALPTEWDESLDPEEVIEAAVGPALARLSLEFASEDDYREWWRQHPSLHGRWTEEMDEIFPHDLHRTGSTLRPRVNRQAVIQAGSDPVFDEKVVTAWERISVPTTLIVVDHGMLDDPGGFMPLEIAESAAETNPNIEVRLFENLNHYTVILGDGAPLVARVVAEG
jgi:pimeloyl-ACP methyl ester carboxylesterase